MLKTLNNKIQNELSQDYRDTIKNLREKGYQIDDIPVELSADNQEGEFYIRAYPIQGILKYHGLANPELRTAYNSSVSINNSCAQTITYLKMDKNLKEDILILNGKKVNPSSNEYLRVKKQLESIRSITKSKNNVKIISRNLITETMKSSSGKGLGTSASAGAAISHAMMEICYKNNEYTRNSSRLRSIFARFLAGSAARSSVGGVGLWLNHPEVSNFDSFAIRLDQKNQDNMLNQISLITIELESPIRTDFAHKAAPSSPFFWKWIKMRKDQITNLLSKIEQNDFLGIAELGEQDTKLLHAVTMTATEHPMPPLICPESLSIIHLIHQLRIDNIPVYYTIDTGPSVVLITENKYINAIIDDLKTLLGENRASSISVGKIGGPSVVLKNHNEIPHIIKEDVQNHER